MIPISYILGWIKRSNEYFNNHIVSDKSAWLGARRIFFFLDILSAFIIHGSTLNDYIRYDFYKKRHNERATFVTVRRQRLLFTVNEPTYRIALDDKCQMHRIYDGFLGRDWLYPREATLSEFANFCRAHDKFVVKPRFGAGGEGVRIQTIKDSEQIETFYKHFQDGDVIIDEVIIQHSALKQLHPSSINTVRLNTFHTVDKLDILSGALRMGNNGSIVDNRSAGGLFAAVDVSTGVVTTPAVDGDLNRYVFHPSSGKQIVGFQIPFWNEIIEFVEMAFQVYPKCPYIGWDIAVTPKGPVLVEANGRALMPVQQQADQIGKWPYYKKAMKV